MTDLERKIFFNKKDSYTYEEARSVVEGAIMDRARTLGFFYKVMPREVFEEYAPKALYELGKFRARNSYFDNREKGDFMAMVDYLFEKGNGLCSTVDEGNYCTEQNEKFATVNMDGKCALVAGWESMGLSAEEVDYMCKIQGYGDYGQCEGLGLKGEWLETSACPGCKRCVLKISKLKAGEETKV